MRYSFLLPGLLLATVVAAGCVYDYSQYDFEGEPGADAPAGTSSQAPADDAAENLGEAVDDFPGVTPVDAGAP